MFTHKRCHFLCHFLFVAVSSTGGLTTVAAPSSNLALDVADIAVIVVYFIIVIVVGIWVRIY